MTIKPNIKRHNEQVSQNMPGTPMPTKVTSIVRRGSSSRYAEWINQMDFVSIREVTVAQNAPSYYDKEGFEKVEMPGSVMDTLPVLDAGSDIEVWVKTATLGGRAKVYVRPIH